MLIKTLYRAATVAGSVRLIQREASKPFVVIIDLLNKHVTFDAYEQFNEAVTSFTSLSGQMKPLPASRAVVKTGWRSHER